MGVLKEVLFDGYLGGNMLCFLEGLDKTCGFSCYLFLFSCGFSYGFSCIYL